MNTTTIKIGILLFKDACPMDFVGPYEAFSVLNYADSPRCEIFTVSEVKGDIHTFDLTIKANYDFTDCPQADIIIIPGGKTPQILDNAAIIQWLQAQSKKTELLFSVCNGALLLAKAGLLKGLPATTHHKFYAALLEVDSTIQLQKKARFIDNGSIVTSAGISAGIDAALYIIDKKLGKEAYLHSCEILEYGDA
ncbi:DJ-1/PfpI family protein [Anaerosinus massiliensis]|uniref:DJ-1/PfpI family protein n=1 Tax=Massilibacillus massiliensis TaxID=1806837 RepID=UPI000A5205F8|nr:DJ-1/PfpI family protein [Massilibacillus massiliensis]